MPKGWNTDRPVALASVRTLQMQYRIEYTLNRHLKSKNNKPVKHKALVMPLGNLAMIQFVDHCLLIREDQSTEYMDLYFHFRKLCLDSTEHPDMDLSLFEQRLEERIYQVKHQIAFKIKSGHKMSPAAKQKAMDFVSTNVRREGKYWVGIGIIKPTKFSLHLPDGFMSFDASNDDEAYEHLCSLAEFNLHDDRLIAGKNYLRFSRQKFWLRK